MQTSAPSHAATLRKPDRVDQEALPTPGDEEESLYQNVVEVDPQPKGDGDFFNLRADGTLSRTETAAEEQKPFVLEETLEAQMERFGRVRALDAQSHIKIMHRGTMMVELAKRGDQDSFNKLVLQCKKEELPYWFIIQSFREACLNFQANMIIYLTTRGLDLQQPPLRPMLIDLLEAQAAAGRSSSKNEGAPMLLATMPIAGGGAMAGDHRMAPIVDLLVRQGVDINFQRPSDWHTALHIACRNGMQSVVKQLLFLGADVNAVAKDDVMPLHSLDAFEKENQESGEDADIITYRSAVTSRIERLLEQRRARRTWRTGGAAAAGAVPGAAGVLLRTDDDGGFSGGC